MKSFLTYFLTLSLVVSLTSYSISDVVTGLKTGNASQVSKYFDNTIDITFPDKSNSFSRSQAELVLKDFFYTNGVVNFQLLHSGESAGSQYLIGTLQTRKGLFRTTVYIKQKANKQVLQELRFER